MNLAECLRERRKRQGLTIRLLAERSGVGRSTISRWEQGQCLPSIPELDAVLKFMHVSDQERSAMLEMLERPRARRELHSSLFAGDVLRALRYRAGLSLEQTSKRIQVGKTVLSRWETGERTPSSEVLSRLGVALEASDVEIAALLQGLSSVPSEHLSIEERLTNLRQAVREGVPEPLDLEFISLEYRARQRAHYSPAANELASHVRALYIEWLGWWYRDREAAMWADRQLPNIARSSHLPIWGRVIRAKNVFMSEFGPKEPGQRLNVLGSALTVLRGTSSEAFVRRELASELSFIGYYEQALAQVAKARRCSTFEEDAVTHYYCCDMVEAATWLAWGQIDRAMRALPNAATPVDPYLRVSSTVGRSRLLVALGQSELAKAELEKVRNDCVANGYGHFAQSAETALANFL